MLGDKKKTTGMLNGYKQANHRKENIFNLISGSHLLLCSFISSGKRSMFKIKRLFSAVQQPYDSNVLYRLVLIYSGYRLALSFFLIALFLMTLNNPVVGGSAPYLYLNALAGYACHRI